MTSVNLKDGAAMDMDGDMLAAATKNPCQHCEHWWPYCMCEEKIEYNKARNVGVNNVGVMIYPATAKKLESTQQLAKVREELAEVAAEIGNMDRERAMEEAFDVATAAITLAYNLSKNNADFYAMGSAVAYKNDKRGYFAKTVDNHS